MTAEAIDLTNPKLLRAVETVRKEIESKPELERDAAELLQRFGKVLHPENLSSLSAEDFKSFLNYNGDNRWWGIHHHAISLTSDMERLQAALGILLNEKKPLDERLRKLRPADGDPPVKGLARSVITPILHMVYPGKYGVLNRRAEEAMKLTGVYPTISPKADFARIYISVNDALVSIAKELSLPLWALNLVWARVREIDAHSVPAAAAGHSDDAFGVERHLHGFLLDNWDSLGISKEWELYEKEGEIVGSEYRTEFGRIDLLARHVQRPEWLVIELKRDKTADATIGQVLRYMGWVQRYLAGKESVKGLVICRQKDAALDYALSQLPNVTSKVYRVTVELVDSADEPSVAPQAEESGSSKDNLKDGSKDNSKDSSKDSPKDSSKDNSKDNSKDSSKDNSKDNSKEKEEEQNQKKVNKESYFKI